MCALAGKVAGAEEAPAWEGGGFCLAAAGGRGPPALRTGCLPGGRLSGTRDFVA